MKHDRRASSGFPGSLVNFKSRERNGAFGLAARVGKWDADKRQTKKRSGEADLEIQQGSAIGGAQVCEFQGVVFQGESKARSLVRRGGVALF